MIISVGIPVYDGKLPLQLVLCLLAETSVAQAMGDQLNFTFLPSCSNLAMGRNQLVKQFLESDADRLVFIDADVTFEMGSIIKLAHAKCDFVGGAYRLKQANENYPIGWLKDPELKQNAEGFVEVAIVPTGFLSLSRNVFKTFRENYPDREYQIGGVKNYCYFQIPYFDGALYTEDAFFCREWKEIGGKIFLDPNLTLTHWDGNIPYKGNIGQWLNNKKPEVAA